MVGGFTGKILRVDLGKGEIKVEDTNMQWARDYIGGQGLATRYYVEEVDPKIDPYDPDNELIIAPGPLTGTSAPTAARYMAVTKSPLTGTITRSNSGGYFGAKLKHTGFDMIIFKGRSEKPVYLYVDKGKAEIRDASDLWGKDVFETTDTLTKRIGGNVSVACIGPAGENLVKFASIMNDKHRAAGRNGVGAVMGSKKLKAIVAGGGRMPAIGDPEMYKAVLPKMLKKIKENPVTSQGLTQFGTEVLVNIINRSGIYSNRNLTDSGDDPLADDVSGETLAETYLIHNQPCFACPIGCGRVVRYNERESEGPEYESTWALGPNTGVHDLYTIIAANDNADRLGYDTISAGLTISAAMELYEKGKIPDKDVGPTKPKFGNTSALLEMTAKIGYRKDFGDKLAEGSYRLAKMYGDESVSMSVKGQEIAAYDPRGVWGLALEYATSNIGGSHMRAYTISNEILGVEPTQDPLQLEGKADLVKYVQDFTEVMDCSGLCQFPSFALNLDDYIELVNAVTGFKYTKEEIMKAAERVWNLERLFNLKAGIKPEDDKLPERFLKVPLPKGPKKGNVVPMQKLLQDYYGARGWDSRGYPTEEKIKELGLEFYKL
ncbi:probable aldehyde ferredoxin oxidoreductase [Thermoplasma acidophilum]|uniref:Probable aldehyde ferredoxin oxidoreductase n=1 Tax=Thermoplasma acidophilum (strain ATCC 25905 / DSM 1728 / JCM 9062 / NBRC 15155 / AMRC-C165) TaxID=273075 RepID=Q9HK00_THEAC|nr:aldehyde ferredoxin oxidoreductase family protein [Thermoplasma acidophilum]CAC11939.1 probable aldehyde ferredoxin oxidoreductase [Thermoplasma acidophilum]